MGPSPGFLYGVRERYTFLTYPDYWSSRMICFLYHFCLHILTSVRTFSIQPAQAVGGPRIGRFHDEGLVGSGSAWQLLNGMSYLIYLQFTDPKYVQWLKNKHWKSWNSSEFMNFSNQDHWAGPYNIFFYIWTLRCWTRTNTVSGYLQTNTHAVWSCSYGESVWLRWRWFIPVTHNS